jgi:hypothetical protein
MSIRSEPMPMIMPARDQLRPRSIARACCRTVSPEADEQRLPIMK